MEPLALIVVLTAIPVLLDTVELCLGLARD